MEGEKREERRRPKRRTEKIKADKKGRTANPKSNARDSHREREQEKFKHHENQNHLGTYLT